MAALDVIRDVLTSPLAQRATQDELPDVILDALAAANLLVPENVPRCPHLHTTPSNAERLVRCEQDRGHDLAHTATVGASSLSWPDADSAGLIREPR